MPGVSGFLHVPNDYLSSLVGPRDMARYRSSVVEQRIAAP